MTRLLALLSLTLWCTSVWANSDEPSPKPVLDVVFVLDTTSSMGGLIEGAKQKIWSIASRMASGKPTPDVRVGLVAYRDQGDAYVTQVVPLTKDLDAVYQSLRAFQAEGGGDGPEAVQDGLADAVKRMPWSDAKRAAKMIFLVGDAPAHPQDEERLLSAAKQAIAKGIVVNTIRCGGDGATGSQFSKVARLADGHFDTIDQQGGVVAVATPFDEELARLNGHLVDTALYAGRGSALAAAEARRADTKTLDAPAAADRLGYLSKAGGSGVMASGSSGAGIVDLATTPEKAASVGDEELPAPMRTMTKAERVAFAKAQQAKRTELEKKIAEVSKQRDDYLAKHAATAKDSFDERVFESVKAAAKRANVVY